jgi:xylulokinase
MFIQSTYDAICAVIGSGNGQEGNACDVSGTVTSVRMLINQTNHTVSSSSISTQNIDIIKKQIVGASNNLGGGLIEWVKQAFYADNEIDDAYHLMERDASKSGIGASGIIFLPYLLGERAPFSNPYIKGEFIGISRNVIKPDFTRAVFEATAYISRDLLSLIEQFNVRSLSVSGGLARFDSINQIKADVLNLPVYVLDNFESTSIGSLLLCLLTVEHDSYESLCNKLIKIRKIINPMQNNHTIYNDLYHFFVHCRNTMLPLYKEHYDIYRKLEGYAIKGIKNL